MSISPTHTVYGELNIKYPIEFLAHSRESIWGHNGDIDGDYTAITIYTLILPPQKNGARTEQPLLAGGQICRAWDRGRKRK